MLLTRRQPGDADLARLVDADLARLLLGQALATPRELGPASGERRPPQPVDAVETLTFAM
jgi:hypothetical protein